MNFIFSRPTKLLSNQVKRFLGLHFIVHKLNIIERRLLNLETTADTIIYEKAVSRIPLEEFRKHHHSLRANKIIEFLKTSELIGHQLLRVGSPNDGGYVMIDDFENRKDKIAYSIGIGSNVDWDSAVAQKGYSVFMYDHTIRELPTNNSLFLFREKGLGAKRTSSPNLMTLSQMLAENHHSLSNEMLLKIDIEGAEWDIIPELKASDLCRFDQILIELHDLFRVLNDQQFYDSVINSLKALNAHHSCIHVHINSACPVLVSPEFVLPSTVELTFALRSKYTTQESALNTLYPLAIDSPTFANKFDIPTIFNK